MLSLEFMRLALATALVIGLVAPVVGFFLVERRLSLLGDAVGHSAFAGVAAGYLLGVQPLGAALVTAVLGAVAIEGLRSRGKAAGDQALALLLYTGMAAGIVLVSAAHVPTARLIGFLFGSILTVTPGELALIAGLGAVVLALIARFFRPLLAVALDEQGARASGLPVSALNVMLAALAAVTITVAMRAVGLLLVAALMVLPVMSAARLAWSVRSTVFLAMALGAASSLVGLALAYAFNTAPGGTIVLVAAAIFALAVVSGRRGSLLA